MNLTMLMKALQIKNLTSWLLILLAEKREQDILYLSDKGMGGVVALTCRDSFAIAYKT